MASADPAQRAARADDVAAFARAFVADRAAALALVAAKHGSAEVLAWLMERGGTLPHQRAGEPHGHLAERLKRAAVPIDEPDPSDRWKRTLLRKWSEIGQVEGERWLLAHGADARQAGPDGRTALHHAAQRNTFTTVAELLLAHGADVAARDHAGRTALDNRPGDGAREARCLPGATRQGVLTPLKPDARTLSTAAAPRVRCGPP